MLFSGDTNLHLSERLVVLQVQQNCSVLQVYVSALQIVGTAVRVVVRWKGQGRGEERVRISGKDFCGRMQRSLWVFTRKDEGVVDHDDRQLLFLHGS